MTEEMQGSLAIEERPRSNEDVKGQKTDKESQQTKT